jgi:hypothetical protein
MAEIAEIQRYNDQGTPANARRQIFKADGLLRRPDGLHRASLA